MALVTTMSLCGFLSLKYMIGLTIISELTKYLWKYQPEEINVCGLETILENTLMGTPNSSQRKII